MATDIHEHLTKYLTDAHSIEVQALAQMRSAPDIAGDEVLSAAYREHLRETEGHEHAVRGLLEARGESPSRLKDVVMAAGGKGFLLFARLQPDTPGKLHSHALSYEALELSSYELLAGVADAAEEAPVADAARGIAQEELRMMERLESTFDLAVEASLREHPRDDLAELVQKYLADAHAIEEQAAGLLGRGPKLAGDESLAAAYRDHLEETRGHKERIERRLSELGGSPSRLKDAAMKLGALNWGAFFAAHPDTPGKLAGFARAFEYLEIGGYEQLARVARRAGDEETVRLAEGILIEERQAATRIADLFPQAIAASLGAQGVAS